MTTRKLLRTLAAAMLLTGALALGGCATKSTAEKDPGVWGYVADARNAKLELATNQPDVSALAVDRVLAPGAAWLVVHADDNGKPGKRVGLLHVDAGESRNVTVPLKALDTASVFVALHADRGTKGKFDFDMMNKTMSPDRPFFVNEKELAVKVTVR